MVVIIKRERKLSLSKLKKNIQPNVQLNYFDTMRKIFKSALPLTAVCAMMVAATSCGGGKSGATADKADDSTFATDSITWVDSTEVNGSTAKGTISMAYPVSGPQQLVDSVRGWIGSKLAASVQFDGSTTQFTPTAAQLADGSALAAAAGTTFLTMSEKDFKSYTDFQANYEGIWTVDDIYSTPELLTYSFNSYIYLGGAHGSSQGLAQTFRVSDGALLGTNMFVTDSLPRVTELVKDSLAQYFKENGIDNLKEALLVNPDTLPLPVNPPYLMADGVHFIYQQYEIAPYAAGMPGCVLPYSTVAPMLKPDVAALLPK